MTVYFYIKTNHLRIYKTNMANIYFFFDFFDLFHFSTLGPGTMLIASGPEFCEERRIRYVRCSYFDPVREKKYSRKNQHYVIINWPEFANRIKLAIVSKLLRKYEHVFECVRNLLRARDGAAANLFQTR